jgi:hypothetical protein
MESNCVICLLGIDDSEACKMIPCGHTFHSLCIQTWLVQKMDCPICRSKVSSCHHGNLEAHDSQVLLGVVEAQKSMIASMKIDAQIADDTAVALQMRMEIVLRDSQYFQYQYNLYHLFLMGSNEIASFEINGPNDVDA